MAMQLRDRPLLPSHFHLLEPDYDRPPFELSDRVRASLLKKLAMLYGPKEAKRSFPELERIIQSYYAYKSPEMISWEQTFDSTARFSEKDVILITYGDLIREEGQPPLQTLVDLSRKYLKGVFNTLHILPFFPSSSDRGFAVKDFTEVDHNLGSWEDIAELKNDFRLMFDGVFNHVSTKSHWFQEFLNQNPRYLNFFTVFSTSEQIPPDYLKLLVRPRTTEVLTPFNTLRGKKYVWTTFSRDQVDLNFANPEVLTKMVEILLLYVRRGADLIRLDAVSYLWDELGTAGIHLDQNHIIIKIFREILDAVAPHVVLITETNVPHHENIKYFGNGHDEAQMVYNFALPPLVLHAFQTGNARKLTQWAATLKKISSSTAFFNFLDSHDGVGVMAVRDIMSREEIEMMALKVIEHGGFISYKRGNDGKDVPYELNITWYSAINAEDRTETANLQVKRYLASRAIALVMQGIPGIYLHGLLGSRNDAEAVIEEEQIRSINRKTLIKRELIRALLDPQTTTYQVTHQLANLILYRSQQSAFAPNAEQNIFNLSDQVFSVQRVSQDGKEHILTLTNVTAEKVTVSITKEQLVSNADHWEDILSHQVFRFAKDNLQIVLQPYDLLWLKAGKCKRKDIE